MGKGNQEDSSRILRIQCANESYHDVSFEVAMMSPRLEKIIQDINDKENHSNDGISKMETVYLGDLPSKGVEHAIEYLRCVFLQKMHGDHCTLREWGNKTFVKFDSRVLCELASASYHLDLQPLVDITCRSIAQMMASSETAQEVREKFGCVKCTRLDCPGSCNSPDHKSHISRHCETFDFSPLVFEEILDDVDEAEGREVFDERSLDDLIGYINGTDTKSASSKKKRNARRKKKMKKKRSAFVNEADNQGINSSVPKEDANFVQRKSSRDIQEKVRVASIDPSAVFDESKFEDVEETDLLSEIESFRQNLENAHREYAERPKIVLPVPFAYTNVKESTSSIDNSIRQSNRNDFPQKPVIQSHKTTAVDNLGLSISSIKI